MSDPMVNVDAGEHQQHEKDVNLLKYVDALNVALGAHAGDPNWSRELAKIAIQSGKRVHLHPGYEDRERFGRVDLNLPWSELATSLNRQRSVLPEIVSCKFHGAIYNRSIGDLEFAERLIDWCVDQGIDEIVTIDGGCLAIAAMQSGVSVLREAFVDRRYVWTGKRLALKPRSNNGAVITVPTEAVAQAKSIVDDGCVRLADGTTRAIQCDTLCLHGDGVTALDVAKAIYEWKRSK